MTDNTKKIPMIAVIGKFSGAPPPEAELACTPQFQVQAKFKFLKPWKTHVAQVRKSSFADTLSKMAREFILKTPNASDLK